MSGTGRAGVGVIGAGVISEQYLESMSRMPDLDVRFVADLDADRARAQAERHGVPRSGSVEELLADESVEVVVNLTIPAAHVEVGLAAVRAGKHVWNEKPLALDLASARSLLEEAEARGLQVGCAPDTVLGPALQAGLRAVREGLIGTPLTAFALFQVRGPESWHPSPDFLYAPGGGPLFDMGPYYLTTLVHALGAARRVTAARSTARPTRVIGSGPRAGEEFPVVVPSFHSALVEFESGASAQVAFSFQAARNHPYVLEVAGSAGSIDLPDPNRFEGESLLWIDGREEAERIVPATSPVHRGTGVLELVRAARAGVAPRASGRVAEHVLELMLAIRDSAEAGRPVELESSIATPEPLPGDWDPLAATLAEAAA